MSELTYQEYRDCHETGCLMTVLWQYGSKEGQLRGTTEVKTRSGKAKQVHLLPGCVHTCSFQVPIGLGLHRMHDNTKSERGQLALADKTQCKTKQQKCLWVLKLPGGLWAALWRTLYLPQSATDHPPPLHSFASKSSPRSYLIKQCRGGEWETGLSSQTCAQPLAQE